jgi:hypothetical protein
MAKIRKLSPDEVNTIERRGKSQRRLIEEQYDAMLQEFAIGDYGDVDLDSNEKRLTVRNRLRAAANRRGIGLQFKRLRGDFLRFRVVEASEDDLVLKKAAAPAPVVLAAIVETPVAGSSRRGRRKKEEPVAELPKKNGRRGRPRKVEA